MTTTRSTPPQLRARQNVDLTRVQKVIGVCLLLFYLVMIGVTIATLPYVGKDPKPSILGVIGEF